MGLKQNEFTKCMNCNNGIMKGGNYVFFKIEIEQHIMDMQAQKEKFIFVEESLKRISV